MESQPPNIAVRCVIHHLVEDKENISRIIGIDIPNDRITAIQMFMDGKTETRLIIHEWTTSEMRDAFESNEMHLVMQDPYRRLLRPDVSSASENRRNKKYSLIEPIVEQGYKVLVSGELGALVAARAEETDASRTTIYGGIRRHFQGGMVKNAQTPDFYICGSPQKRKNPGNKKLGRPYELFPDAGINVTDRVREHFHWAAERYAKGVFRTKKKAYDALINKYYVESYTISDGVPVPVLCDWKFRPSLDQFYQYLREEYGSAKLKKLRAGTRKANLKHRPLTSNATQEAFGPGSIYQFDTTPVDVTLVSWLNPNKIIKRIYMTLGVDVWTHEIISIEVTLENTSWMTFVRAFEIGVSDKVTYCKGLGIAITENEWNAKGIPEAVMFDRAPEYTSNDSNLLLDVFGIHIMNTAPYRADMKGIVESLIGIMNRKISEDTPGEIPKRHERGDANYRLRGRLNIKAVREIAVRAAIDFNKTHFMSDYPTDLAMLHDGVEPNPLDLWTWGISNRGGMLRPADPEVVRANLYKRSHSSITGRGVYFNRTYYQCQHPAIQKLIENAAITGKREHIIIAHNPHGNANQIFIPTNEGELLVCEQDDPYNKSLFWGRDPWEIRDFRTLRKTQKGNRRNSDDQSHAEFAAHKQATIAESTKVTEVAIKEAGTSNAERQHGARATTEADKAAEREQIYGGASNDSLITNPIDEVTSDESNTKEAAENEYIPTRNYHDVIKKTRQVDNQNE